MICLKNRTFAVSQTTLAKGWRKRFWLWFAWKIVLLQYRKQPLVKFCSIRNSCDLLEKSYFCSIANNESADKVIAKWVVICLKNRTFAVSQTTQSFNQRFQFVLWFAWKIVLLQYRKQLSNQILRLLMRCDLLEKSYFCSIANNDKPALLTSILLWFAWKIVLLQYRKQLSLMRSCTFCGCDLLEKSYFCSIANNERISLYHHDKVVICLKNRTFAVSQTTVKHIATIWMLLWFAWKIVLLQYRKQQLKR